jgi:hypothetical protein
MQFTNNLYYEISFKIALIIYEIVISNAPLVYLSIIFYFNWQLMMKEILNWWFVNYLRFVSSLSLPFFDSSSAQFLVFCYHCNIGFSCICFSTNRAWNVSKGITGLSIYHYICFLCYSLDKPGLLIFDRWKWWNWREKLLKIFIFNFLSCKWAMTDWPWFFHRFSSWSPVSHSSAC